MSTTAYAEISIARTTPEQVARKLLDAALVPAGARVLVRVGRQPVDMRGLDELRRQADRGVRITFSGHARVVAQWRTAMSIGIDGVIA